VVGTHEQEKELEKIHKKTNARGTCETSECTGLKKDQTGGHNPDTTTIRHCLKKKNSGKPISKKNHKRGKEQKAGAGETETPTVPTQGTTAGTRGQKKKGGEKKKKKKGGWVHNKAKKKQKTGVRKSAL